MTFRRIAALALAATISAVGAPALAQEFPTRPVRIVVPSAAGGGFDLVGRLLADQLSRHVGGAYVVENIAGAGTLAGTRAAAKLPPDGHGLLVGGLSNLIFNLGLYASPGYQPAADFVPLGIVYSAPYVLVARKDLPYKTLAEIVAAGRAKPGSLTVATAGLGTGQDIMATVFSAVAEVPITKVPYRGSGPVYPDLITGRVDLFVDALSSAIPQAEGGNVAIVATTGARRSPRLPDVPTVAEAGMPELTTEQGAWIGLFARAGTPDPVVRKLREGVAAISADPAFRRAVEAAGGEPSDLTGDQARALIEADTGKWLPLMKKAGIEPQ